jgi:hypothetical protein
VSSLSREVVLWSGSGSVGVGPVVVGALALAGPVAYGVAAGQVIQGSLAALGAISATGVVAGSRRSAVLLIPVVALAGFVAVWGSGRGWVTVAVVTGVAAVASLVGSFSRWMAEATARFITLLVIASGLGSALEPLKATQYFVLGACWAVGLGLLLPRPAVASHPFKVLWRRWTRRPPWRFAVELTLSLLVAEIIGALWHQQKAYWIALTVAIVVRRSGGSLVRGLQRCAGTLVGVVIGGALVLWVPPSWVAVALVAVLAAARPYLRARNYAAYAVVMTPLLVLMLDLGRPTSLSTMGYRLLHTLIGCAIALAIVWLPEKLIQKVGNADGAVG